MRMHIVFLAAFLILGSIAQAQDSTSVRVGSDTVASSRLLGLYRTYPLLTKGQKQKIEERREEIGKEIKRIQDSLSVRTKSDTVSIPGHMTFLGGLLTYPKLTEAQKVAKKGAREIEELKRKMKKMEEKRRQLHRKLEQHEKYVGHSILWGAVAWHEEKSDKETEK